VYADRSRDTNRRGEAREKRFMKSRVFSIGAMILLAATSIWAADVAGKWTAKVPGAP